MKESRLKEIEFHCSGANYEVLRADLRECVEWIKGLHQILIAADLWRHGRPVITEAMVAKMPCPFEPDPDL